MPWVKESWLRLNNLFKAILNSGVKKKKNTTHQPTLAFAVATFCFGRPMALMAVLVIPKGRRVRCILQLELKGVVVPAQVQTVMMPLSCYQPYNREK